MKNPYIKIAKYLEKQPDVLFQNTGTAVYMSDGFIAVKVPADEYHEFLCPVSDFFPRVMGIGCWIGRYSGQCINCFGIEQYIESYSVEKALGCSPFLAEFRPVRKKAKKVRLFFSDSDVIAVDEELLSLFSDYPVPLNWRSSGQRTAPMVHNDGNHAVVISPLDVKDSFYAPWKR